MLETHVKYLYCFFPPIFYKICFHTTEALTVIKDSVIDFGSRSQSHSLLHHSRNSILVSFFRREKSPNVR